MLSTIRSSRAVTVGILPTDVLTPFAMHTRRIESWPVLLVAGSARVVLFGRSFRASAQAEQA